MVDTANLDPQQIAKTISTVVSVGLIQAAGALETLRAANQALYERDVETASRIIRTYLAAFDGPQGVLVDLDTAIYSAIPRH